MTTTAQITSSPRPGPEWARHIAGKAMAERDSKPAELSWLDELILLYLPR